MRYNEEADRRLVAQSADPHNVTGDDDMVASRSKSTRSPAFQFYPRDFLSSRKVDRMSMTERGIYITLLSHCWIDRGLPTDLAELASACRMKPEKFERIWTRGVLHLCFELRGDRFLNPRLEAERKVQAEFSRKQKEKAEKRWGVNATAMPDTGSGNASFPSLPIPSHPISSRKSAEPPSDSTPVVLAFPVVGDPENQTWELRQSRVDSLAAAYPNLDVVAQCRKALAWSEANPAKRKTAKGMPAFLFKWMDNATNRGESARSAPVAGGRPRPAWAQKAVRP